MSALPPSDPFPAADFDDWAATYDESVAAGAGFPFDGYAQVLQGILEQAAPRPGANVLDLGIGTGNLAALFVARGCAVWGLDFSPEMVTLARRKLPQATLAVADIRAEWPPAFQRRFDAVVSAYTFHHFVLEEKVALAKHLVTERLVPGGRLVIGDIAFENAAAEDAQRHALGDEWEQEYYWLADDALAALADAGLAVGYTQVSSCAGIFIIQARTASEAS